MTKPSFPGPEGGPRSELRPTLLRLVHGVVGVLQQLGDDRLDVLAHVSGLGERGAVADGEGDVQAARQRLRQQRLPCNDRREHAVSRRDARNLPPRRPLGDINLSPWGRAG